MQAQTQQTRNAFTGYVFLADAKPKEGHRRRALTGGEIIYTKTGLVHRAKDQKIEDSEE